MRPFDKHIEPALVLLKKLRMTANMLTALRVVATLPAFWVAVERWPFLLPVLCLIDGFLDIADGAFARVFNQQSPWGAYSDQGSDKISAWGRLYVLMPLTIAFDYELAGESFFWSAVMAGLFLDIVNFAIRTTEMAMVKIFGNIQENGSHGPNKAGKVKTWCQQFGVALFAISYSYTIEEQAPLALYASVAITAMGVAAVIPPRDGIQHQWCDVRWWTLSFGLAGLATFSCVNTFFAAGFGQFAFLASVACGAVSTYGQIKILFSRFELRLSRIPPPDP